MRYTMMASTATVTAATSPSMLSGSARLSGSSRRSSSCRLTASCLASAAAGLHVVHVVLHGHGVVMQTQLIKRRQGICVPAQEGRALTEARLGRLCQTKQGICAKIAGACSMPIKYGLQLGGC